MSDDIKNVACVGSGLIGQGWATLFAAAGFGVVMQDISDKKLNNALEQVRQNLIAVIGTALERCVVRSTVRRCLCNPRQHSGPIPSRMLSVAASLKISFALYLPPKILWNC